MLSIALSTGGRVERRHVFGREAEASIGSLNGAGLLGEIVTRYEADGDTYPLHFSDAYAIDVRSAKEAADVLTGDVIMAVLR